MGESGQEDSDRVEPPIVPTSYLEGVQRGKTPVDLLEKNVCTAIGNVMNTGERVLDPEVQTALFVKLKTRFEANMNRHEGVLWADVQRLLEVDPSSLWKLQQMENAGHEPDVYMETENAYLFGTCSAESPESTRNAVYGDNEWANLITHQQTYPPEDSTKKEKKTAVDLVTAMGVDLMSKKQYIHLQTLGDFDIKGTEILLKTPNSLRRFSTVLLGTNDCGDICVWEEHSNRCYFFRGFRVSHPLRKNILA